MYKMDYNKVLEYHIQKRADITIVCKKMNNEENMGRFGQVKINDEGRVIDFEEKPMIDSSPHGILRNLYYYKEDF